jgi:energy-coupling factor transporter ATP-binding protein EcfA2
MMAKIEKITFIKNWRTFKKDECYILDHNINVLVGDQGSGKSSLLKLINESSIERHYLYEQKVEIILIDELVSSVVYYFDSEHMNSRVKSKIKSGADMAAIMSSHGQVQNSILTKIKNIQNSIILIDEPETSLSIKSTINLIKLLDNLSKNNQIIISTHHPLIISHFNVVLSVEHKKWLSSEDFFNLNNICLNFRRIL